MVGLNLPSCCFLFILSILCSFSSHFWINWNTLFYIPFISSVVLFIIPLCFIFSVVAIGLSICTFNLLMTDWMQERGEICVLKMTLKYLTWATRGIILWNRELWRKITVWGGYKGAWRCGQFGFIFWDREIWRKITVLRSDEGAWWCGQFWFIFWDREIWRKITVSGSDEGVWWCGQFWSSCT